LRSTGTQRSLSLAAAALVLVVCALDGPAAARRLWYPDMSGHWAETYVRVLWEEGVVPPPGEVGGVIRWPGRLRLTGFRPNAAISRSDFGDMLVRVFPGDPFPPPRAALSLAGGADQARSPGRGVGQASGRGWVRRSSAGLSRQEAVAVLVEALGLGDVAQALDAEDAWTYIRQFRDGSKVAPVHRRRMALAVRLGIIEGYPDRTLRPGRSLTRAEAAAVIYRSCLFLVEAGPNPFSPDGDGVEDVTVFSLGSLRNRNARGWDLAVLDGSGRRLKTLRPEDAPPEPPEAVVWDGTDDQGRILPAGVYYYRGWLVDRNGLEHRSVLKPVFLEEKSVRGFVHPAFVLPGETLHLSAFATGRPASVTVDFSPPVAGEVVLTRTGRGALWTADLVVPGGARPGVHRATFTARYPGTTRRAQAVFEVGAFTVTAALEPNPVPAGGEVLITAWPSLPAAECRATVNLPDGRLAVPLSRRSAPNAAETWQAGVTVPRDTPAGRYGVIVSATRTGSTARATLWLEVTEREEDLVFILVD